MMKKGAWILVLVIFSLGVAPALAAKPPPVCGDGKCNRGEDESSCALDCGGGGGPSNDVPVCATLRDNMDDGVQSDASFGGAVSYCSADPDINKSQINASGRFNLITGKGGPRQMQLNFPGCEVLTGNADCLTEVNALTMNERATGQPVDLLAMGNGDSAVADFQIAFPSSSKSTPHLLGFGGTNIFSEPGCGDPLTMTRVSAVEWTLETSAGADAACLFEVVRKNKREISDSSPFPAPLSITLVDQQ